MPTYFHVDAAQGFGSGKLTADLVGPIDRINENARDQRPKGIGALLIRERDWDQVLLTPLMYGGDQEQGCGLARLPVPLTAGLGRAATAAGYNEEWWPPPKRSASGGDRRR